MIETAKKLLEDIKEDEVQAFNIGKDKAPTGEAIITINIRLKAPKVEISKPMDISSIREQYKNY